MLKAVNSLNCHKKRKKLSFLKPNVYFKTKLVNPHMNGKVSTFKNNKVFISVKHFEQNKQPWSTFELHSFLNFVCIWSLDIKCGRDLIQCIRKI